MIDDNHEQDDSKPKAPAHKEWGPSSERERKRHIKFRMGYRLEREAWEAKINGHPERWDALIKARNLRAAKLVKKPIEKVSPASINRKLTPLQIKMLRSRQSDADDPVDTET